LDSSSAALFVIPQRFLFVIPQRSLFVIPQRSGGICFSSTAPQTRVPHVRRSFTAPIVGFSLLV
jgi:hypothetical protein